MPSKTPLEFSIVFESFNITQEDLAELAEAIESLYRGTITPDDAKRVIVLDNGSAPPSAFDWIRSRFPAVEVVSVPSELALSDVRFLCQQLTRSPLVLTFDADCFVDPGWLDGALATMAERPEIAILTGEISIDVTGPYSLGVALAWIFPPYSGETAPSPSGHYYPNCLVARREAIDACPHPVGSLMRRGQAIVHSRHLIEHGTPPWRDPRLRSRHVLPSFRSLVSRFLVMGHDSVELNRQTRESAGLSHRDRIFFPKGTGRLRALARRARLVLAEDRRRWLGLPVALPIVAVSIACFLTGRLLTSIDAPRTRRWLGIEPTPEALLERLEDGSLLREIRERAEPAPA